MNWERRCEAAAALLWVLLLLSACSNPLFEKAKDAVETAKRPGAPSLTVSAVNGRATLTWSAVSGATSYNVYWAQGSAVSTGSGTKVAVSAPPLVIKDLADATQYAFLATAVNSHGEGEPSAVATATTGQWTVVGVPGFPASVVAVTDPSLATSPQGVPHLAYPVETIGLNWGVSVDMFDGSAWTATSAVPSGTGGSCGKVSLAINQNGVPYLAYGDVHDGQKATVVKYTGSSWVTVGTGDFSSGQASYISLAIHDGVPYVAFADAANAGKATVMTFDGSNWSLVGTAFSSGGASNIALALDSNGIPYVAYRDLNDLNFRTKVWKFENLSWTRLGIAATASADYLSLAIDPHGSPLVARKNIASGKASVATFDGSIWVSVGPADFSAGQADYTSLAIDSEGTPYIAFENGANGSKATVMKFNGTSWVNVGVAGFSAGQATGLSLALDPSGTPYVAYIDAANSNKLTVQVHQ